MYTHKQVIQQLIKLIEDENSTEDKIIIFVKVLAHESICLNFALRFQFELIPAIQ